MRCSELDGSADLGRMPSSSLGADPLFPKVQAMASSAATTTAAAAAPSFLQSLNAHLQTNAPKRPPSVTQAPPAPRRLLCAEEQESAEDEDEADHEADQGRLKPNANFLARYVSSVERTNERIKKDSGLDLALVNGELCAPVEESLSPVFSRASHRKQQREKGIAVLNRVAARYGISIYIYPEAADAKQPPPPPTTAQQPQKGGAAAKGAGKRAGGGVFKQAVSAVAVGNGRAKKRTLAASKDSVRTAAALPKKRKQQTGGNSGHKTNKKSAGAGAGARAAASKARTANKRQRKKGGGVLARVGS